MAIDKNMLNFLQFRDEIYVQDTDEFPNLKLSNLYRNWGESYWRLKIDKK